MNSKTKSRPETVKTPGREWQRSKLEADLEDARTLREMTEKTYEFDRAEVEDFFGETAVVLELDLKDGEEFALDPSEYQTDLIINVADSSTVKLHVEPGSNSKSQTRILLNTGEGSNIELNVITLDPSYAETMVNVQAGKNTEINANLVSTGKGKVNKFVKFLLQDDSEVKLKEAAVHSETAQKDSQFIVEHIGENTRADIVSRHLVTGNASTNYEGLQQVRKSAKQTQSFQDMESVKLTGSSTVNASPKLNIENPDVEASHSAGVTELDEEKTKYLETRGIAKDRAETLALKAFLEPVVKPIPKVESKIEKIIQKQTQK